MSILDKIKVYRGDAFPLGITRRRNKEVQIATWYAGAKSCYLCLYEQGTMKKFKMYSMKDVQMPDIFSLILSGEHIEEDVRQLQYHFLVDGEYRSDPFAKSVYGRKVFGRAKAKVKHGFEFENFDWEGENWRKLSEDEMILYQCHVRGFTRHKSSGVKAPGTFSGLQEKIPYLKELGINTLLLLPVYEFNECMRDSEGHFNGKVNYWGYTGDAFYMAPKASYCSGELPPPLEFQQMIKAMHQNGLNVMMDIYFVGMTPEFVLQCLRYYAFYYHIDGFRINQDHVNLDWIYQDPMLSHVKIIGNHWQNVPDMGAEPLFYDMNDGFMVDARRYLKSDEGQVSNFYQRFKEQGIGLGQIHYITQNNGFTLRDLVSYDVKHNDANGERGRDGTELNYSWNCGFEGKTRRKQVLRMRAKQEKNAFVMLFLGMAVPMLLAGDEFGNSQKGNNNAYCQDNLTTWLDWRNLEKNRDTFEFAKKMIWFRKKHPLYHQRDALTGMDRLGRGVPDVSCHGREPWVVDFSYYSRELGILYYGSYFGGQSLYFAFNFHWDEHEFFLPDVESDKKWKIITNTAGEDGTIVNDGCFMVAPRSIVVFEKIADRPNKKSGRPGKSKKKKEQ